MATVAEIKELKREDLDKLAVEQGLDPATYSKKEDLQAELLKSADDANSDDTGNDDGDGDQSADEAQEQNTTTSSADQAVNDADKAADAAEKAAVRKPASTIGHAGTFDKNGQPVFGKGRA